MTRNAGRCTLRAGFGEPDETIAAAIEEGAMLAGARGAPDRAADLLRAAIALTPGSGAGTGMRRLALASFLTRAGDLEAAVTQYRSLLDIEAAGLRPRVLRLLAEVRLQQNSLDHAVELLEASLAQPDIEILDRVAGKIILTYVLVQTVGPAAARGHAAAALLLVRQHQVAPLQATAIAVNQMAGYLSGEGVDGAEMQNAVELEAAMPAGPSVLSAALIWANLDFWNGDLHRAADSLQRLVASLEVLGDEVGQVYPLMLLTWVEAQRGQMGAAEAASRTAFDVAERIEAPALLAMAIMARAAARRNRADDDAMEDCRRAIELCEQSGWRMGDTWPLGLLGSIAWSRGDAATCVTTLAPLYERMRDAEFADPGLTTWLADLIEAYIALGDLDTATRLLDDLETASARLDRAVGLATAARCRALVVARAGRTTDAIAACAVALHRLNRYRPQPIELGRTFLVLGRIQRRAKRRADSRASLSRARQLLEPVDAPEWIAQVDGELARIGQRGHANELTQVELRAAVLAAAGLTNREVADRLFLTPKSVEGVLGRAYDKLGISSRAELGAWAARKVGCRRQVTQEGASLR